MRDKDQRPTLLCANCDIEIEWGPTVVQGRYYCCLGCAQGGPCSCDYSQLPTEPIIVKVTLSERRGDPTARHRGGN